MSQYYLATAGTVPSYYLSSISTDLSMTLPAYSPAFGLTTPVGNNIRALGDQGIVTISDPAQPELMTIRFSTGEVQTTDATQTTIKTFTMVSDTCLTYQVIVAAYSTDNLALGGNTIATFKNVAGVASVIDEGDLIVNAEAGLIGAEFGVDVSGATIIFWVKGLVGKTINWTVCFPGVVST